MFNGKTFSYECIEPKAIRSCGVFTPGRERKCIESAKASLESPHRSSSFSPLRRSSHTFMPYGFIDFSFFSGVSTPRLYLHTSAEILPASTRFNYTKKNYLLQILFNHESWGFCLGRCAVFAFHTFVGCTFLLASADTQCTELFSLLQVFLMLQPSRMKYSSGDCVRQCTEVPVLF